MPRFHIDLLRGPLVVQSFDYDAADTPGARVAADDWIEKQTSPQTAATRAQISQGRDIVATKEPIADGVWSMANY
jgi:hypothetical protein